MLVGDVPRLNARSFPHKTGLVFGEKRLTWSETYERVRRLADGLGALGIGRGDRAAILARNSHRFFESYFALATLGAIAVPLNFRLRVEELIRMLLECDPKTLLFETSYREVADTLRKRVSSLETDIVMDANTHEGARHLAYEPLITQAPSYTPSSPTPVQPDDTFAILYTSGTTSEPKGVMISHRNLIASGLFSIAGYHYSHHDRWLASTSLCFMGPLGAAFPSLLAGATCVITDFDPDRVITLLEREQITGTSIGPTALEMLVAAARVKNFRYPGLQRLTSGGAPLALEILREVVAMFGAVVHPAYGLTESTGIVSSLNIAELDLQLLGEDERFTSVGNPHVGVEVKVVDEEGREIPPGEHRLGEVLVRGDHVTRGYWQKPEATAQALRDGWLYTGDLGQQDAEGYIYLMGRKDDLIKSGGLKIAPKEVEDVIGLHPGVKEVAVVGLPHRRWGEAVAAFVVPKSGWELQEAEVIAFFRERLAGYKKPQAVYFLPQLPRNDRGKVLKVQLKALAQRVT